MQITINFEKATAPKEIAAALRFQANLFDGLPSREASSRKNTDSPTPTSNGHDTSEDALAVGTEEMETPKPAKTTPPKAGKTTKVAAAPKVEDIEDEEFDLGDEPEEDEVTEPAITVKQVITAFQAYVAAQGKKLKDPVKGRKAAAQILAKYKAKSVYELKPEQYGKILSEIEV